MSVANGNLANQTTFNNAFMSRTGDTSTTGAITQSNTTQSTTKDTGAIVTEGGVGIEKNLNVGGTIKNADTTSSTTKDTGAIVTEGGLGVEENINAGGNITATGTMAGSNLSGTNTGDLALTNVGSTPAAAGASLSGQNLTLQPADATNPGVVTAAAQTIGGLKTFADGLTAEEFFQLKSSDDATSGDATALVTNSNPVKRLTAAGNLTSIGGLVAPSADSRVQILINTTGASVTIKNEDAGSTAANRILTGTAGNIDMADDAVLIMIYNFSDSRWHIGGGSGGGGSVTVGADLTMTAGDTLAISLTAMTQSYRVQGNSAAITMSTTPFGSSAPTNGALVELIGNDDTNTVSIDWTDSAKGCVGSFTTITLAKYERAAFRYNSSFDRWVYVY
ncbi:MAG: hypothetical protein E6R04_09690 [Spirochaetes bacterium]|nr:MAG: hypothetical protein E6R04_09690 [Spirochaetota bacterium]